MSNHQITADHAANALEGIAKLVSAAPEDNDSQPDAPTTPGAIPEPNSFTIRESFGWGRKYVNPIPLTGDRWHEVFADASALVAKSGLVVFIGNRGPGKTQMAAEIARAGNWPNDAGEWIGGSGGGATVYSKSAVYRRAMDIFLDLREASKNNSDTSEKKVLAKLEKPGLLVIDEFQERGGSEWENRIMANLLDKRYAAERPTIIIANYTVEEIKSALSDSVKSRMRENGKAFEFTWESYRKQLTP